MAKKKDPVDAAISGAWSKLASGVAVNIMDIPKIFKEVRAAHAAGSTIEDAVVVARDKYRQAV
jgi:hypothetical protein